MLPTPKSLCLSSLCHLSLLSSSCSDDELLEVEICVLFPIFIFTGRRSEREEKEGGGKEVKGNEISE